MAVVAAAIMKVAARAVAALARADLKP